MWRRAVVVSGLLLGVVAVGVIAYFFAPYLKTQTTPPPELAAVDSESAADAARMEQEIITGRVLVRLTEAQVLALRAALTESPVPSASATETPQQITEEPAPTLSATETPSSEPLPASTEPAPTESTTETPTEAPMPTIEGSVLGATTSALPNLPDFAVIDSVLEKAEFVSASSENVTSQSSTTLTELLKTKVAVDREQDIPAVERWVELDLTGPEVVARVNNAADLMPVGAPSSEVSTAVTATRSAIEALRATQFFEYVEPAAVFQASRVADDPYFSSSGTGGEPYDDLWGLKRIQAAAAWEATTGSPTLPIAVVDSGIDFAHRDLQGNLWENSGEIGTDVQGTDKKTNRIDDDANGYIDDWRGWDFANNDNDPTDDNGHGTHVSGIIAARGNNATDVTGVVWSAQLMPLKFLRASGGGTSAGAAAALRYAADKGAQIINNSWGGYGTFMVVHDALEYAANKGALLIAAAGNEGCDLSDFYCSITPASEKTVIAVGATTPYDTRAFFSNYGTKLELMAPGGNSGLTDNILSLRARGTSVATPLNETVTFAQGTSMAAPYVTGVAGLLAAQHPDWTADQLRTRLQQTADDWGVAGRDSDSGFGLVNAARAVGQATTSASLSFPSPFATMPRPTPPNLKFIGSVSGSGLQRYVAEIAGEATPIQWTKLQEGTTALTNTTLAEWPVPVVSRTERYTLRLTFNPDTAARWQLLRGFTLQAATTTPTPTPSPPPLPSGGSGGDSGGGGSGGGGGGGGEAAPPQTTPKPAVVLTFQAEKGHTIQGSRFSGIFTVGKRTVVRLADNQSLLEKTIRVPRGAYWLEFTASHDRPAPVQVAILINGRRWKTIALNKNDDKYRTMRVGKLSRFGGGKVTFRLLNDSFDRKNPGTAAADRNFELDSWRLVSD